MITFNFWGLPWPFSVHKTDRRERFVHFITKERPDIIACQELWLGRDIDYIRNSLEGYFTFDKRNFAFNHSGLAVFSTVPLTNGLYIPFDGALLSMEFPSRKGVLRCEVELNDKTVQIINTHAYYSVSERDIQKQRRQLDQLIEILDNRPTLLFGDFNILHNEIDLPKHFTLISEKDNPSITLRNYYATRRLNKINAKDRLPDYIFANFPVRVKKSFLVTEPLFSDHYPVVVEVEI